MTTRRYNPGIGRSRPIRGICGTVRRANEAEAVRGREEPPSIETYLASTQATLALAESLLTCAPAELA
jgi:hypothetical protein